MQEQRQQEAQDLEIKEVDYPDLDFDEEEPPSRNRSASMYDQKNTVDLNKQINITELLAKLNFENTSEEPEWIKKAQQGSNFRVQEQVQEQPDQNNLNSQNESGEFIGNVYWKLNYYEGIDFSNEEL